MENKCPVVTRGYPSQDSQWKPMLLCIWEINEIKSIKQKLRVKNTQKFNKTCSDLWKIHKSLIRPVVTYGIRITHKLKCFLWRQNNPEVNYSPTRISGGDCF
jgi:hypothetical protein